MVFIKDPNTRKVNKDELFAIDTDQKTNKRQDVDILSLKETVASISNDIDNIIQDALSTKAELENKINSASEESQTELSEAVKRLSDRLDDLISGISTLLSTAQVKATTGNIRNLTSTTIKADDVETNSFSSETAEIVGLNATHEEVETIHVTEKIEAAKAVIGELIMLDADLRNLITEKITADKIITDEAEIKRLDADLITVSAGGTWRHPIVEVDNTELLHIKLPKYKGTLHFITENGILEITILDGTVVSFRQETTLLYRIDFKGDYVNVYLNDMVSYKLVRIGTDEEAESYSEKVDRTEFDPNINVLSGLLSEHPMLSEESSLSVVSVAELPEVGIANTIYILHGNTTYYCNGLFYVPLTTKVQDFHIENELTLDVDYFIWNGVETIIADDEIDLSFVEV